MNTPDANSVSLRDENACIIENSDIVDSDYADFSASNNKIESENIESVGSDSEENVGLSNLLAEKIPRTAVRSSFNFREKKSAV